MKFSCDKSVLCEAVNNVSLAVSKSNLIALEGILMECKGNALTMTGYNLELGITKTIPIHGMEDGTIIIDASRLGSIVNRMPAGEISFSSDAKLLTLIQCGNVEFTILGLAPEDYPEMPMIAKDHEITLEQESFRDMIAQTLFAVAQTEQTPVYTGSLFELKDGTLSVVSVDGYRMAMKKQLVVTDEEFRFIVPGKTLNEIQKLLVKMTDAEEPPQMQLRVSSKHIIFTINGYNITSRLLEGDFLDYNNAIPKGCKTKVRVSVRDFLNSINRASIIINDRAKSPIKCEFAGNVVRLNCETTLGKLQDSFLAEKEGEDIRIGFNNKYMADALKASSCDELVLEMSGPLSPIKLVPVDGDDFLFLVLPIRLKD